MRYRIIFVCLFGLFSSIIPISVSRAADVIPSYKVSVCGQSIPFFQACVFRGRTLIVSIRLDSDHVVVSEPAVMTDACTLFINKKIAKGVVESFYCKEVGSFVGQVTVYRDNSEYWVYYSWVNNKPSKNVIVLPDRSTISL